MNEILRNEITGTQLCLSTNFGGKLSFIPSYFFSQRLHYTTYIFTVPICTITLISLKPCALIAEFQHFILKFNKISLLCGYH
jgi:hypothetical protein